MGLTATELSANADTQKARLVHLSLHTADPGATGASEAVGGSYARISLTWGASTAGVTTATEVTFNLPAGTFTHFGTWSAAVAGTFRGGEALDAPLTLSPAGQGKVTISLTVANAA